MKNDFENEHILKKFEPFYSSIYGIINQYYFMPNMPHMPNLFYGTCKLANFALYTNHKMNFSIGGCGETMEKALIATLGEALERYSASVVPYKNIFYATHNDLIRNNNAIDPEKFSYFLPEQYEDPKFVIVPFRDNTFLGWVEGFNLITKKNVFIPACYVYIPYLLLKDEKPINHITSTGLAFGFTKEEAILSGLCEIIERDCFSIVWHGKVSIPRVDFRNTGSKIINELLDNHFQGFTERITILDMTNDLHIPAFLGFLETDDLYTELPVVCFGAAANPDKEKALYKTLVEIAQTYVFAWHLKVKNKNNGICFNGNYAEEIINFDRGVLFYSYKSNRHFYDFLKQSKTIRSYNEIADYKQPNIYDSLDIIIKKLSDNGFSPIVVDITSSDIKKANGFVIRTIVPELVPLNGAYKYCCRGHSRIYNVPYKMGYYTQPLLASQINTAPHPFP